MEKERLSKKQIIPLVIGILTLVILVSSATYAYFSVTSGKTASSTTITGDIGGGTIGTVTLSGGGTNLYLGLSAYDMSESKVGTTYYSSTTQGSRETNVNSAGKATYTATLSGDESDEVMYACDYEFTLSLNSSADYIDDFLVVFEGDINKTVNFLDDPTVRGTWYGFKNSNPERSFNAYLQLTNTEDSQNYLAGTNTTIEISNTKWKCYLSELDELDELVGEAYALITASKEESRYDLTFIRSQTAVEAGYTYNGMEVIESYTGFEEESYTSSPWAQYGDAINVMTFEDEIRPLSTAHWFENTFAVNNVDFSKLNMINVKNVEYMFRGAPVKLWNLSSLDVSDLTNMSGMFWGLDNIYNLDLSNWDVSNVTDMSNMFRGLNEWGTSNATFDLSNWNTSKVTDMSGMFSWVASETGEGSLTLIGVSNWDVSNVTNMSGMFEGTIIEGELDLSKWNVSNVTSYENFSISDNITPPVWKPSN